MPEYETQILKLEARLRQLKVRKQRTEARRRARESQRWVREEARRRYLVGAAVLMQVDRGALETAVLRQWLDTALSREDDRALFGL
jgi:hypothetical protein